MLLGLLVNKRKDAVNWELQIARCNSVFAFNVTVKVPLTTSDDRRMPEIHVSEIQAQVDFAGSRSWEEFTGYEGAALVWVG
jgi:hypothetical protein|tara:strand:+ start:4905 stop:5147 length:243 start_codon:yes stop_codon:yes gene_type:complete